MRAEDHIDWDRDKNPTTLERLKRNYRSALKQFQVLKDLGGEAQVLQRLAEVSENPREARSLFNQALVKLSAAGLPLGEACAQGGLAELELKYGAFAAAQDWATQAREGFRKLGQPVREAGALQLLGTIAGKRGNGKAAHEYVQQAAELFRQAEDWAGLAGALAELGRSAFQGRKYTEAKRHWTEALAAWQRLPDSPKRKTSVESLESVLRQPKLDPSPQFLRSDKE